MLRDAILLEELPARLTFASPKLRILACPRLVTKMFAGLVDYAFCMGCVEGLSDLDEGLPLLLPDLMDGAD